MHRDAHARTHQLDFLPQFAWLDEDVRNHHEGSTPASPKKSTHPRMDRFVDSLMPFSWSEYRWQFFSTFNRFMAAVVMTVIQLGLDLNAFFLLHMLQIPVSNKLNHLRLLLVITLAFPATSEWCVCVCVFVVCFEV
jgi:hypothetical protein